MSEPHEIKIPTPTPAGTFDERAAWLFDVVRRSLEARRRLWEAGNGPVDDETAQFLFERPIVCVEHDRFVPCRTCMYNSPASAPYSDDDADVDRVRRHQNRGVAR
jgi:hypothetical protein